SCLEFDSVTYLKRGRAAGGVTVVQDVPDSPEPE
ncbi:jg22433, partial [Pararge aegeria aegeria]